MRDGQPDPARRSLASHAGLSRNFVLLAAVFFGSGAMTYHGLATEWSLTVVFILAGWVVGLCLHEYGHARVAYQGGDVTVGDKGYLTLDFTAYVDPLFSLLIPTLLLIMGGLAFPGAAVLIRDDLLRSRLWSSLVSAAGPAASLLFVLMLAVPFWLGLPYQTGAPAFWGALAVIAFFNVSATVISLIPVPGLDGYGIVRPWLPKSWDRKLSSWGAIVILGLFVAILLVPAVSGRLFEATLWTTVAIGVDVTLILGGLAGINFWLQ